MILGKLFTLLGLEGELGEILHVKHLEQCLAYSHYLVYVIIIIKFACPHLWHDTWYTLDAQHMCFEWIDE